MQLNKHGRLLDAIVHLLHKALDSYLALNCICLTLFHFPSIPISHSLLLHMRPVATSTCAPSQPKKAEQPTQKTTKNMALPPPPIETPSPMSPPPLPSAPPPTHQRFIAHECRHLIPTANPSQDAPLISLITALCPLCKLRHELSSASQDYKALKNSPRNSEAARLTRQVAWSVWARARAAVANHLFDRDGGDGCSVENEVPVASQQDRVAEGRTNDIDILRELEAESEIGRDEPARNSTMSPGIDEQTPENDHFFQDLYTQKRSPTSSPLPLNNENNKRKSLSVRFANHATIIHSHRDEDQYRDQAEYDKTSESYDPGAWAAQAGGKLLDTSGLNKDYDEWYDPPKIVLGKRKRVIEDEDGETAGIGNGNWVDCSDDGGHVENGTEGEVGDGEADSEVDVEEGENAMDVAEDGVDVDMGGA